uniref:Uncharacterized protein n=1 Tax=Zooxanthella nutricula TaxID=1333877 RepID=A0A6U6WAB0_9DINO
MARLEQASFCGEADLDAERGSLQELRSPTPVAAERPLPLLLWQPDAEKDLSAKWDRQLAASVHGLWSRETTPGSEFEAPLSPLPSPRSDEPWSRESWSDGAEPARPSALVDVDDRAELAAGACVSPLRGPRRCGLAVEAVPEAAGDEEACEAGEEASEKRSRVTVEEVDPGSPQSVASMSHIERWSDRDETLIIFDWDDTLCPTTHYDQELRGGEAPQEREAADLEALAVAVRNVLQVAAGVGRVAVVTMAATGWVEDTMQRLLPGLGSVFDDLDIPVVLAREGVPTPFKRQAFADCREPSQYLKRRAMARVIQDFYTGRLEGIAGRARSWKNILSIGDSWAERNALQDLVFSKTQRDRRGRWKECRCKTMKLLTEPTLAQLTEQVSVVAQWIPTLVCHDGDLDINLDEEAGAR